MKGIAIITGASSGIGRATAIRLAQAGFGIIATGRRAEKLNEIQKELPGDTPYYPLVFDVRDRMATQKAFQSLPEEFQKIEVLINNAGNAHGLAPVHEGDYSDWAAMMDSNVMGLLHVTEAVLPYILKEGKGTIINISSIAGRQAYANGAVYCASKAAVDKITEGLRIDLNPKGIRVASIAPGMVETEFSLVRFKGDEKKAASVYAGLQPLSADDIADTLTFMVTRPYHINIADVLILPTAQASATVVARTV